MLDQPSLPRRVSIILALVPAGGAVLIRPSVPALRLRIASWQVQGFHRIADPAAAVLNFRSGGTLTVHRVFIVQAPGFEDLLTNSSEAPFESDLGSGLELANGGLADIIATGWVDLEF